MIFRSETFYPGHTIDRVLYTPERLTEIAKEAAKPKGESIFSLNDRIGLVHDAMALSKAGLAKLSSALTLVDVLREEKECEDGPKHSEPLRSLQLVVLDLVWFGIAENLDGLISIWWEHPELVDQLNAFRRVCRITARPGLTRLTDPLLEQELFVPLVQRLGYEYSDKDSIDTSLLRTLAITQAAGTRDEGYVVGAFARVVSYIPFLFSI